MENFVLKERLVDENGWQYYVYPQSAFKCSKVTIETLEQGVKYDVAIDVVLVSLLLTLNIFHTFF